VSIPDTRLGQAVYAGSIPTLASVMLSAAHARPLGSVLLRFRTLSFYDALMIAAAADAGCPVLPTQNLQPIRKFGVMIVNPFHADP
jgi:predicted nucleic acid-binding protein